MPEQDAAEARVINLYPVFSIFYFVILTLLCFLHFSILLSVFPSCCHIFSGILPGASLNLLTLK